MIDFDIEAATNEIATIERTFVSTSFDYGQDPYDLTNVQLPAVVHWERGPTLIGGNADDGLQAKGGTFSFQFEIESKLLLVKAVPDEPLSVAKKMYKDLWLPTMQAFLKQGTLDQLCLAANSIFYEVTFPSPSFARTPWPMTADRYQLYWAIIYIHRFYVYA